MKKHTPTKSNGCLWMLMAAVLTLFAIGIMKAVGLPTPIALTASLIMSYFITNRVLGKPPKNYIWSGLLFGFLSIGAFTLIFGILTGDVQTESTTFNTSEKTFRSTILETGDTIPVFQSNRYWNDNFGKSYTAQLIIREQDYLTLYNHIAGYKCDYTGNFWGNLYKYIDQTDAPKLDLVLKTFETIGTANNLNQMEFAEMVVSCVQDIPYSFVFEGACLPAENYDYNIRKVLDDCPECCIGGVKFGIQNPLTFLQSLKGDCDTRTVLIYSILKHFGYDVAILNSDFYRHSILGVNLPATGDYKAYSGKRYLLWETTAKYFKAPSKLRKYSPEICIKICIKV